jgi:hypothetical protein
MVIPATEIVSLRVPPSPLVGCRMWICRLSALKHTTVRLLHLTPAPRRVECVNVSKKTKERKTCYDRSKSRMRLDYQPFGKRLSLVYSICQSTDDHHDMSPRRALELGEGKGRDMVIATNNYCSR